MCHGVFGYAHEISCHECASTSLLASMALAGQEYGPDHQVGHATGDDPVGSVGGEELGLRVTIAAEDDVEAYRTVRDLYLGAFRAVFGFSPEIGEREVLLQEKFDEREER